MNIMMTGLDYKASQLSVREKFAFSKEHTKQLLADLSKVEGIGGCVIISTCNRTEVYAVVKKNACIELTKTLCELLNQDYDTYGRYFTQRTDDDAIRHLFKVAAGFDSQILGDDQIITQVRESLELSRSFDCTESYIETFFRYAIKAAKRMKTEIVIRDPKSSTAPYQAVSELKKLVKLEGKNVLVIGNGHMGKLASEILIKEKANVTITLREYKKGVILIPEGARTILYGDRYHEAEKSDIIISATASPHFTLHYEDFKKLESFPKYIVDLAVPRDIDPEIKNIENITLLTIDDLSDKYNEIPQEKVQKAEEIIKKEMSEYYKWRSYKEKLI